MATRSVMVVLGANISGFVAKMREAEMATKSLAAKSLDFTDKHSQGLSRLSTRIGLVGLGITSLAGFAVKAAVDWESAWKGVTKTVNATPAQLSQIEVGLRGLAKSMPETHAQIAAVAEAAGQLGVSTGSIVEFTKTMVMLGDTTNLSADEAATSIAQLMNVMQTAPGEVDNLGAALVALGNNGASTERDIIQMAQRIASSGKIIGLSEANVLSLSNALASTGVEAEAGGTAISQVMIKISQAVSAGGKGLNDWAGVAGMSADKFATAWKTKPAEALTSVVEGLGRMSKSGKDVFGTLDTLGLSGIRTTTALLNLANGGDMLRKSFALGDQAWRQNTALTKEAGLRYDTTAAKAKIAANVLRDDMISAGQALLPMAAKLAESVAAIGNAFGDLPGPVKSSLGVLTGVGGIALLGAAGLMKLTIAVAETRTALAAMEVSSVSGVSGLSKIARYATAAAIALTAFKVAGKIGPSSENVASTAKFTSALIGVAGGSKSAMKQLNDLAKIDGGKPLFMSSTSSIKGLKDAFDGLDASGFDKFFSHITPYDDKLDNSAKAIAKVDDALTSMVSSGKPDIAAAAFKSLSEETGRSTQELLKFLPNYSDALTGLMNDSKTAAKATDDLGSSLQNMVPLTEEAQKALNAAKQATIDTAMSFFDMAKGLDASTYSFQGWIKGLEDMARAQANWADNLILATQRGVSDGVIAELEKLGPAGAKALDDLAHGTEKDIKRVNDAFDRAARNGENLAAVLDGLPKGVITQFKTKGDKAAVSTAVKLAQKYHMTPSQVTTILSALNYTKPQIAAVLKALANVDNQHPTPKISVKDAATAAAKAIQKYIDHMHGKNLEIHTSFTSSGVNYTASHNPHQGHADGGEIRGPGGPRDDVIPIMASNREFIVNAVDAQANIDLLNSINSGQFRNNAQQFADGGQAKTRESWSSPSDVASMAYSNAGFGGIPAAIGSLAKKNGVDERGLAKAFAYALNGMTFELTQDNRYLKTRVRNG